MAITSNWSVDEMTRTESDGGVILVYWSCVSSDSESGLRAQEGGKLRLTPDPSASDFIPYASLTEANVLGWVYDSLTEDDETAADARERIEKDREAKVQGQIDRASAQANGVPW